MGERNLIQVFLVTQNVESLLSFYRDIVGLRLSEHEPGHSAWFDTGLVKLVIHRPESGDGKDSDYLPDTSTVIWLQPGEGVTAAAEGLAEAGVELLGPRQAGNYLYFRDPEGRLIGLHQPEGGPYSESIADDEC